MKINDKEWINENIKELDDLHTLVNLRKEAYKNGQKLDDIYLLTCDGNLILSSEGELCVSHNQTYICEQQMITRTLTAFPNTSDKCPICHKPFTIASLRENCVPIVNQKYTTNIFDYSYNWHHKSCHEIYDNKLKWDHFRHVIHMFEVMAQIEEPVMINTVQKIIKTFQHDCYHVVIPWDGSFYVTIRKNNELSILIEWSDTYPEFSDTFDDIEKTTDSVNSDRMIYVKSYTDMVNVLVRAHKSIIKK